MSERAVEKHIGAIFQKLGLSEERELNRRVAAVITFLEAGGSLAWISDVDRRARPHGRGGSSCHRHDRLGWRPGVVICAAGNPARGPHLDHIQHHETPRIPTLRYDPTLHSSEEEWHRQLRTSPVRIQWDPERTMSGEPLLHRSVQVGIGPEVVPAFVNEWIRSIEDITKTLPSRQSGAAPLPVERPYPLLDTIACRICG